MSKEGLGQTTGGFKTEWSFHSRSADANAYYGAVSCKEGIWCLKDNSMEIPTAFLQGAYFSEDRPQYMNFGAAGSVIGHEITHGLTLLEDITIGREILKTGGSLKQKLSTLASILFDKQFISGT